MSRPSVPPIQPTDLRDVASEERVERIWGRLEQDLGMLRARPARASRTMVWAVAATFAAFGGGLFAGKILWKEHTSSPSPVVATHDRATVDVFAAGSQERSYALPGGGRVTLAPGSMIELERAGGSDVRLRLLAGEASLDTGLSSDQALAIVSGEATVATAPGSTVRVRHRTDNLDVRVASGSAQVSSPAGTQALLKGDQMDNVPTRTLNAVVSPPVVRVAPVRTGRMVRSDGSSVAVIAVAPTGWREQHAANKWPEALELLKQQPGGIAGAVSNASGAAELMAINDLARLSGNSAQSAAALKRVADEFTKTGYASTAAYLLSKYYEAAGLPDQAKKYREQAAQKGVLSEDALCAQIAADDKAGNKEEASARATEYLGKYPNGRCKDEAQRISSGGDAAEDGDTPEAAEPVPAPAPTLAPAPPATPAQKP